MLAVCETPATAFDIELGRIEAEIAELDERHAPTARDSERATRFAYRLFQRASLTGDLAALARAGEAVEQAIRQVSNPADLYFVKANLDFALHRLADVRGVLDREPALRDSVHGRALRADLDFQAGQYDAARQGFEDLVRSERTWDALARLAYFNFKMGDTARADALYAEAEEELTAKEMRHYAWVELQRGVVHLSRGRHHAARAHYERANRAYSGYWLVAEHMAELLGAEGRFDAAAAVYRDVIAHVPRPELLQALGEIYALMDESDRAHGCFERALDAYHASAERGEVHYYHHLADLYADVLHDGAAAVHWARRDLELRQNFSTQAALAWAMHRAGAAYQASDMMERALASGVCDARLFFQAAEIQRSLGTDGAAERYATLAAELNPRHLSFHVHR
jgi:tetratricopeptide (TPR) repeat protein